MRFAVWLGSDAGSVGGTDAKCALLFGWGAMPEVVRTDAKCALLFGWGAMPEVVRTDAKCTSLFGCVSRPGRKCAALFAVFCF